MDYSNNFRGMPPSNNLWVGNNYSSGYSQMSRNNYPMNQMQQPMTQTPQTINNIFEVMGPESAQSYQVGPNSKLMLLDSKRNVFYIKVSDDSGYSETKAYEFHEIPLFQEPNKVQNQPTIDTKDFVTREEFNDFKSIIEDLVMKNE